MTMKLALFVSLMIAALGAPISEAEPGLGSIVFNLIHIQGTLYCIVNTSMGTNGTATPVFPNAEVLLSCGARGHVVASGYNYTNATGRFLISMDPQQYFVPILLKSCKLVIISPFDQCISKSTVGRLVSSLKYIGKTVFGDITVVNIIPNGFILVHPT
ncbi:phylloplanin-like [Quercus lobata]|uniref:Pollen Ole e 1 allergen and extensin family protein n=1 Tax=Quercus lobata TaxID=97700 RepID=A0A7N2LWU0_QUELO|nr:phylloplanin-like [Quercus lobata]